MRNAESPKVLELASNAQSVHLSSLVFPPDSGYRRDHAVPEAWRGPEHDRLYDFTTLAYDAIACPHDREIVLVCPKLFNFETTVRRGTFAIDRMPLAIRTIRKHRRFDEIVLGWDGRDGPLSFEVDGLRLECALSYQDVDTFFGLNVMVAISRNNQISWITDWVRYHIAAHGLEAVIVIDNASDAYSQMDLVNALSRIPGLKAFRVVAAPFAYGPLGIVRRRFQSKFLQVGMLNGTRRRFLSRASAILSIDIDEIVYSRTGQSVFAAARNSFLGYVAFRGYWLFRDRENSGTPSHSQHVLAEKGSDLCPYKYCFVPNGLMGRRSMEVHGMAGKWINRLAKVGGFGYWHCFSVTTNWKNARSSSHGRKLEIDAFATETITQYLGN